MMFSIHTTQQKKNIIYLPIYLYIIIIIIPAALLLPTIHTCTKHTLVLTTTKKINLLRMFIVFSKSDTYGFDDILLVLTYLHNHYRNCRTSITAQYHIYRFKFINTIRRKKKEKKKSIYFKSVSSD